MSTRFPPFEKPRIFPAREPATAIILAGGKSSRMGQDKAMLPFLGLPMIEHIFARLRPHFDEILVNANDPEKYAFLGAKVVPDKVPDVGPLMGIASSLQASAHDLNFVIACDIPTVGLPLVRQLLSQASDYDCVVPVNTRGQYEPLVAVYRKSALEAIWYTLSSGHCRISHVFAGCRVKYVQLSEANQPDNVNTAEDYGVVLAQQLSIRQPYAV